MLQGKQLGHARTDGLTMNGSKDSPNVVFWLGNVIPASLLLIVAANLVQSRE
jgi:hypothetical protein